MTKQRLTNARLDVGDDREKIESDSKGSGFSWVDEKAIYGSGEL